MHYSMLCFSRKHMFNFAYFHSLKGWYIVVCVLGRRFSLRTCFPGMRHNYGIPWISLIFHGHFQLGAGKIKNAKSNPILTTIKIHFLAAAYLDECPKEKMSWVCVTNLNSVQGGFFLMFCPNTKAELGRSTDTADCG